MAESSQYPCNIQLDDLSLPPDNVSSHNSNGDAMSSISTQAGEADPSDSINPSSSHVNSGVQTIDHGTETNFSLATTNDLLSKKICSKIASHGWELLLITAGLLVGYMAFDLALWTAAKDWKAYCDDLQQGSGTVPSNCKETLGRLLSPPPWHGHWFTENSTTRIRRDLLSRKSDARRLRLYLMASKLAPRTMTPSRSDMLVIFFVVIITVILGLSATVFILLTQMRRNARVNELLNFDLHHDTVASRNLASENFDPFTGDLYSLSSLQYRTSSHNELEVDPISETELHVTGNFPQGDTSNLSEPQDISFLPKHFSPPQVSPDPSRKTRSDISGPTLRVDRLENQTESAYVAATQEEHIQYSHTDTISFSEDVLQLSQMDGNKAYTTSAEGSESRFMVQSPVFRPVSPQLVLRPDGIRKRNARFEIPKERNLQTIDALILATTDENEKKELKQQKRLLRNRQAALDSRQRKKSHTEKLEQERKASEKRMIDLEDAVTQLEATLNHERDQWMQQRQQYDMAILKMQLEGGDAKRGFSSYDMQRLIKRS